QASNTEETALKRFMQGGKTARLLSHPNVVGPLDYGFIDEKTPFLVTQYCEGTLLSKILTKEGRLPLAHALDITAQVCDAIEHAHYYGVIHRNLKPGNIMLVTDDTGIEV